MVQRKLLICSKSDRFSPENCAIFKPSLQLQDYSKTRGPETKKKKMKRTKTTRFKDSVTQPGKPPPFLDQATVVEKTPPQKQVLPKVTEGSPNYMKGTSSSEARREGLRNVRVSSDTKILHRTSQLGSGSGSGSGKQSRSLCRTSSLKIARALKNIPSFKKCCRVNHVERATCSSKLKDSKFPEYLMLNHGGTEAEGTSVLKVCPYTYCSLNGHLHAQYPPLKSFISARRRALKVQRSMKVEAFSPSKEKPTNLVAKEFVNSGEEPVSGVVQKLESDGFVEIYVGSKREYESMVKDFSGEPEKANSQASESLTDGAPRSEIDSEENFGCYNDIFAIEIDTEEEGAKGYRSVSLEAEAMETEETDSERGSESDVTVVEWDEEGTFSARDEGNDGDTERSDVESHCANIVGVSEDDGREFSEAAVVEIKGLMEKPQIHEQLGIADQDCPNSSYASTEDSLVGIWINFLWEEEKSVESDAPMEMVQNNEAAEEEGNGFEMNGGDGLSLDYKADTGYEEISRFAKDIVDQKLLEDAKESELVGKQVQENDERDSEEIGEKELAKEETFTSLDDENICGDHQTPGVKFTSARQFSKQEEESDDGYNKWMIKRNRHIEETEELMKRFNPREPNYLPIVAEPDAEKIDLRHQEMEERKNTEEWMIDYALQRAVDKLAPARKRKVALLVEAFETVMPAERERHVPKCHQTHVKKTSTDFTHGRQLQACN